jgi:uncharacterized protein (TIGR00725 family)
MTSWPPGRTSHVPRHDRRRWAFDASGPPNLAASLGLRCVGMMRQIAVVGGSEVPASTAEVAEVVGARLAAAGAVLVCGGLGGVMEAACRGAKSAGGLTVGLLPGLDPKAANPWVEVIVPTGLGEARNLLVVRSAAAVIAIDGEYGTLSEIAFALRMGTPVVGVGTWLLTRPDGLEDAGIVAVDDPAGAVALALELAAAHEPDST